MSDLFGNHIVGFPTRWLKAISSYLAILKFFITHINFIHWPSYRSTYGRSQHFVFVLCRIQYAVYEKKKKKKKKKNFTFTDCEFAVLFLHSAELNF